MRDNACRRMLHHHTFTTASLLDLLEHAGFEVLTAQTRYPHDIYALARVYKAPRPFDRTEALRSSPFRRARA